MLTYILSGIFLNLTIMKMDMFNKQQRGYIIIKQHKKAYFWIINVKNVIRRGHAVKTS